MLLCVVLGLFAMCVLFGVFVVCWLVFVGWCLLVMVCRLLLYVVFCLSCVVSLVLCGRAVV